MGEIKLVLADHKYKNQYIEMVEECKDDIVANSFESLFPVSNAETFVTDLNWLNDMRNGKNLKINWVPASTYWLIDENVIVGAISIRHMLNNKLRFRGGHIAYYVRPSRGNMGYATRMLSLALDICKEMDLKKVLITCLKSNLYSAKTIQTNGGLLESEDSDKGQVFQKYWIDIENKNSEGCIT